LYHINEVFVQNLWQQLFRENLPWYFMREDGGFGYGSLQEGVCGTKIMRLFGSLNLSVRIRDIFLD
jgi:hypothetical protein